MNRTPACFLVIAGCFAVLDAPNSRCFAQGNLTPLGVLGVTPVGRAFEGHIEAILKRGAEPQTILYTIGTNQIRIERGETDRPYAKNVIDRDTGATTLLFPHNRSFVRLRPTGGEKPPARFPGVFRTPTQSLPPGLGPQSPARPDRPPIPSGIGPTNLPGVSATPAPGQMPAMPQLPAGVGPQAGAGVASMPHMPAMPMMPLEQAELKASEVTTNLLGFVCRRYELKQRGEVMEIWATDQLLPFQAWQPNQAPRFGPRMLEEQWGESLKAKKLFPLLVVLRFETPAVPGSATAPPGAERFRFEVKSVKQAPVADPDGALFQPPPDYHELEPLPF